MDRFLQVLNTMLESVEMDGECKTEILRIASMLKDEFMRSLDEIFIKSNVLRRAVYHLAGRGKFLRGLVTYLYSKSIGLDDYESVLLSTSTEMYHLASLIHDDIIDGADLRRGVETVHRKFGLDYAIIAGDLLIIYSNLLLSRLGSEVISIYAFEGVRLADGEALELEIDELSNLGEYYELIDMKTSSLFTAMFEAATTLAGRKDLIEASRVLGRELGYAFQISDDILDYIGDPSLMGKNPGMDRGGRVNIVNVLLKSGYDRSTSIKRAWELVSIHVDKAIDHISKMNLGDRYSRLLKYLIKGIEVRRV